MREKPKSFDNKILNECIKLLSSKEVEDKSLAYDYIVDNIINDTASSSLKDLYENDKITLRFVTDQAYNRIKKRVIQNIKRK